MGSWRGATGQGEDCGKAGVRVRWQRGPLTPGWGPVLRGVHVLFPLGEARSPDFLQC